MLGLYQRLPATPPDTTQQRLLHHTIIRPRNRLYTPSRNSRSRILCQRHNPRSSLLMDVEITRCEGCKDSIVQCVGCWSHDMKRDNPDNPFSWND